MYDLEDFAILSDMATIEVDDEKATKAAHDAHAFILRQYNNNESVVFSMTMAFVYVGLAEHADCIKGELFSGTAQIQKKYKVGAIEAALRLKEVMVTHLLASAIGMVFYNHVDLNDRKRVRGIIRLTIDRLLHSDEFLFDVIADALSATETND